MLLFKKIILFNAALSLFSLILLAGDQQLERCIDALMLDLLEEQVFTNQQPSRTEITTITYNINTPATTYKSGFTIPANTTIIWNAPTTAKVNGPIVFADDSSTLELQSDLYLGSSGTFTATKTFITIDGHGKTIFLGGNTNLALQEKIFNVVHRDDNNATFHLSIDGGGKTLSCDLGCNGRFRGGRHQLDDTYISPTKLALKNLIFNYAKKSSQDSLKGTVFSGFDTVMLDAVTLSATGSDLNYLCSTNCPNLALKNAINIKLSPGKQAQSIQLSSDGSLQILSGATLTTNPGIMLFPGEGNIVNAGTITNKGIFLLAGQYSGSGSISNTGTLAINETNFNTITASGSGIKIPLLSGTNKTIASSGGNFTPTQCINGFVIAGTTTINDTTVLAAKKNAWILYNSTLTIPTGKQLTVNGTLTSNGTIVNNGTATIPSKGITINTSAGIFENFGTLDLQTGGSFTNKGIAGFALGSKFKYISIGNNKSTSNSRLSTLRSSLLRPGSGGHLVPIISNNKIISQTGTSDCFLPEDCTDGLFIPLDTNAIWNDTQAATIQAVKINGPIVFENSGSTLVLSTNLSFGNSGNLVCAMPTNLDISIDGGNKKIVLGGKTLINNGLATYIDVYSNLTIDGTKNAYTLRCEDFYGFWDGATQPATLTIQNATLDIGGSESEIFSDANGYQFFHTMPFFIGHTTLNNVTVHGLRKDKNALFGHVSWSTAENGTYTFTISGNVTFAKDSSGSNFFKIADWGYPANTNVQCSIRENSSLAFNDCTVEMFLKNEALGTITPAAGSSRLWLKNTNFYTGAEDFILNTGSLRYTGKINIYAGNYSNPFNSGDSTFTVSAPCTITKDTGTSVNYFGQYAVPK